MADLDDVLADVLIADADFADRDDDRKLQVSAPWTWSRSIESVADLYDAAAEDKEVDLQVIGQKPMLITGDRDLLFDALANLVDNAIKHGREAGQGHGAAQTGATTAP